VVGTGVGAIQSGLAYRLLTRDGSRFRENAAAKVGL
jgi:hypothetical protein